MLPRGSASRRLLAATNGPSSNSPPGNGDGSRSICSLSPISPFPTQFPQVSLCLVVTTNRLLELKLFILAIPANALSAAVSSMSLFPRMSVLVALARANAMEVRRYVCEYLSALVDFNLVSRSYPPIRHVPVPAAFAATADPCRSSIRKMQQVLCRHVEEVVRIGVGSER